MNLHQIEAEDLIVTFLQQRWRGHEVERVDDATVRYRNTGGYGPTAKWHFVNVGPTDYLPRLAKQWNADGRRLPANYY